VPFYVEALKQRPSAISEWTALGELCLALLDYPNAAHALQTAIKLDPQAQHPAGRRARSVFVRALQTLKGKA
jgi:cytochrome c-type biogenesis protein CcmH/NrfG